MPNVDLSEILRMPVSQRITLVQQIWDSIAADADAVPVTPEQREELDRRLADHERNPDDVVERDQAEKEIRSRLDL